MSFHVASRKQFHNQDVFLSNKSFQSEKVLRSQAVAILKDEWRLERNIIEVLSRRNDVLQLASEINRIFCFLLNLFHYLAKNFGRDYMLREIGVLACLPVT